jgi:uncharacterized protein with HEPN domain
MRQMRGMRNRVVHDYFDIDWQRVWNTVKDDLPPLLGKIKTLLLRDPDPPVPDIKR